jgi:hypothetical protein
MKKYVLIYLFVLATAGLKAQELFVMAEPASNMPSRSGSARVTNVVNKIDSAGNTSWHLMPEIGLGISPKLMVHAMAMLSNRRGIIDYEGISLYAKYRFLSRDDVHKHLRMAVFGRYSHNNSTIHMHEINLQGHNSGHEWGMIATGLLNKWALSATGSYAQALNNGKNKFRYPGLDEVFNYSLSLGTLVLPREYKDYKQTNLNLMVELLGQINLGDRSYYTDIVPSLQLIINSQTRLDFAWRRELDARLHRTAREAFIIRLEHTFFNVIKKRK